MFYKNTDARVCRFFALVMCCVITFLSTDSFAVPGDFDGDNKSDFSVALANRNGSTNTGTTAWLTRLGSGTGYYFWTWGVPADAYVTGRFYVGDERYYPGIVWVRDANLPLEWYIKNAAGQDVFLKFGLPGDSITNLGDWDGDGREDISVVRVGTGNVLNWYVALTQGPGSIVQYQFGISGDMAGMSDVDGDGSAEMVVLRNDYNWYVRDPAEETFTQKQWGLPGDIPLLPQDLDGDGLPDYIIARRTGTLQNAYVSYGNGQQAVFSLGQDSSIPQLGHFRNHLPNFAWSQRDSGWMAVRKNSDGSLKLFQFGIASNAIIRADGTVVQPSSNGRFPATTDDDDDDDDDSGGGGGGDGGSAGCSRVFDSGWLLKPASQDSGGTREGKPLILFSRNLPSSSCLNILAAANGTIIGKYGRFSSERYYSGYGCGSGYSASEFAQRAVNASGSKNIYVQDPSSGSCYGPGPADARTDRR